MDIYEYQSKVILSYFDSSFQFYVLHFNFIF